MEISVKKLIRDHISSEMTLELVMNLMNSCCVEREDERNVSKCFVIHIYKHKKREKVFCKKEVDVRLHTLSICIAIASNVWTTSESSACCEVRGRERERERLREKERERERLREKERERERESRITGC